MLACRRLCRTGMGSLSLPMSLREGAWVMTTFMAGPCWLSQTVAQRALYVQWVLRSAAILQ